MLILLLSISEAHVVGRKLVQILSFIAIVVPSRELFKVSESSKSVKRHFVILTWL